MKLQSLMIIFIIIIIPVIILLTQYTTLQKETIILQTDYDSKLIASTKQAIEAFEVNTVEWNDTYSRYSDSKRRDILASINAFKTSFANSLNITGTTRENILTYVPAIMYSLYTGYYIYTPTYVPMVLNDNKGNAIIYTTKTEIEGLTLDAGENIQENSVLYICDSSKQQGTYEGISFTSNVGDSSKEYKHILKTYVPYSEKIGNYVINYTLDNYVKIYTENDAREGYLVHFNNTPIPNKISININGTDIQPEYLSENIVYINSENQAYEVGNYNYVYNSNNEKCYYDNSNGRFFKVSNNRKIYLSDNCSVGDYNCEYKVISVIKQTTSSYIENPITKLYQPLNGTYKGMWYIYNNETNSYQPIKSNEEYDWGTINRVDLALDYSAINYYAEAYVFTNWVNTLSIKQLKISSENNPEDENSLFNTHRKEVMQNSIIDNLQLAISSYSANSNYEYVLPVFTYEDWEQVLSNVSMTVFVQGIPIGVKYYNNYVIAISSNNKEYVNPKGIYYIAEGDMYYHKENCSKIYTDTKSIVKGYRNTDFIQKSLSNQESIYNYFKHSYSSTAEQACYYCLIEKHDALTSESKYVIPYIHVIARERHVQKK